MSWGELYALMCLETGWSWEYVDEEMTLPRLDGFVKLWKQTPPIRTMLAALGSALGMEPNAGSTPKRNRPDLGAYLEGLASAGIQVERVKNG